MIRREEETSTGSPTTSIYEHIRAHLPADGPGLRKGGDTLPDEAGRASGDLPWAPGAQDGVLTHHTGCEADPAEVDRLSAALARAARGDAATDYDELYRAIQEEAPVITLVDPVLSRLRDDQPDPEAVYALAHRLATTGRHREPVKLGIAMLGLFDAGHHRDLLMTLGRHDEFTLYAAVALAGARDGHETDWWELARNVTGWGRVHLVERLAESTDPQVREWILREGFRNAVMDEYLAGIAAKAGDLAGALADDAVDDDLLAAAGDILVALTSDDGPTEGLGGYADGELAVDRYLRHVAARSPADLRQFLAVHAIRRYADQAWPHLAVRCAEILDRPVWLELAVQGLSAPERAERDLAVRACGELGIPIVSHHLEQLRNEPLDAVHWYRVAAAADADTIDDVVALATELLPLDRIATGPADELGFGPDFAPHRCLEQVVGALTDRPGRGWPLLAAALASPMVRNRSLAARTLAAWDRADWPPEAAAAIAEAADREPNARTAEILRRVLDGRPLADGH